RPRPGGKGFGRGFHRAHDIFGATPRHLGDWAPVRRIFNFEPLTRSAVDPFTANQHAFLLKRGLAFAYFGDSRHCHLHRFFCGRDPASGATTLNTTLCSRARSIDRVESSCEASADVGCPSLGFGLTDSLERHLFSKGQLRSRSNADNYGCVLRRRKAARASTKVARCQLVANFCRSRFDAVKAVITHPGPPFGEPLSL